MNCVIVPGGCTDWSISGAGINWGREFTCNWNARKRRIADIGECCQFVRRSVFRGEEKSCQQSWLA